MSLSARVRYNNETFPWEMVMSVCVQPHTQLDPPTTENITFVLKKKIFDSLISSPQDFLSKIRDSSQHAFVRQAILGNGKKVLSWVLNSMHIDPFYSWMGKRRDLPHTRTRENRYYLQCSQKALPLGIFWWTSRKRWKAIDRKACMNKYPVSNV